MTLRVGISPGDPNGIGPEITLKALVALANEPGISFLPLGDPDLLRGEADRLGLDRPAEILPAGERYPSPAPGKVSAQAGAASASWVIAGVDACLRGEIDALVTAPICKESWNLAGIDFPGHTELLADRCGSRRFGMLLVGKGLRVMLATRHLPLREVPLRLCEADIRVAVELLLQGLPRLGVESPRVAVCGLNPHAGDGGVIGTEEKEWIGPLLDRMRAEGLPVEGPCPADTVFHQAVNGAYDAVVALYHDQGLAPLKLWAFDQGVNITLGLPVHRVSPDHGTAFAIAGQNRARPDSMIEACRAAAALARQGPPPWKTAST